MAAREKRPRSEDYEDIRSLWNSATATSKETMNDPNDEKLPATKKARRGELVDDDKQEAMKKEEKKQEAEDENNSVAVDTTAVAKIWSPQRASRVGIKVRSLEDGNLRGGDFVLDTEGKACTISFLFERESKIYGLTAGHLADIGDQLEIFAESQADEDSNYPTLDIGPVVSKDAETDSLIFQIRHLHVLARVDLLTVSPKSGLNSTLLLPKPDTNPTPPQEATDVVIYGAKRRGANGVVAIGSSDFKGKVSKKGDIRYQNPVWESISYGTDSLTDGGLWCLYLVANTGISSAMHHSFASPPG
jgi:hypothetical protein